MSLIGLKRKWYEGLSVTLIVIAVAFLVGSNVYYQQRAGKQRALFYQLQILRNSLNLYKMVNRKNPENLKVLATGIYKFPGDELTRRYVDNAPIDARGEVVDPFSNPYDYDSATGWLRSSTRGYEFW